MKENFLNPLDISIENLPTSPTLADFRKICAQKKIYKRKWKVTMFQLSEREIELREKEFEINELKSKISQSTKNKEEKFKMEELVNGVTEALEYKISSLITTNFSKLEKCIEKSVIKEEPNISQIKLFNEKSDISIIQSEKIENNDYLGNSLKNFVASLNDHLNIIVDAFSVVNEVLTAKLQDSNLSTEFYDKIEKNFEYLCAEDEKIQNFAFYFGQKINHAANFNLISLHELLKSSLMSLTSYFLHDFM